MTDRPAHSQKPLRVLHVISGLHLGGAETLLYHLLTRSGPNLEHEVICLGTPEWYSARIEARGVPVHHLGMTGQNLISRLRTLRRMIRHSDADVIQSWLYVANVLTGICARQSGIPVVWGIHAASIDDIRGVSRVAAVVGGRASGSLADFVINCSSRTAETHAGRGYAKIPSAVIHNGYDGSAFAPDERKRRASRKLLGVGDDTFLIGSIARWHPHKDIPSLLDGIRAAADQDVPLRCLLIGRDLGAHNSELSAEIRRSRCQRLVVPLGLRADISDLGRALDLHVLSSRSEAFPNVVAETMLSGTPNLVTDVGDSALMVGDTGWVVAAGDSAKIGHAIVEAYREWSDDKAAWKQRRRNARKRIAERFSFDKMADAYEEVWRRVAKGQNFSA